MARPRVITANIATLDGRIAGSPSLPAWRDERWLAVRRLGFETVDVGELHGASVRLEGSNSFVARDAPSAPLAAPTGHRASLSSDFLPEEVLRSYDKWMVVPDSRGRVQWTQRTGGGAHLLVLVGERTPTVYLEFLREERIPYLRCGAERIDLPGALEKVARTLGTDTIVSTAGGILNGVLLRHGLVDEVDLQILPVVMGISEAPTIFEGYQVPEHPIAMRLLHQEMREDGSLFLRFEPVTS